jgi:excisionase family DNA binding protein
MEKLLFKPLEAAEALGIGPTRLRAMLASGEIPSVRIGPGRQSTRITRAALEQWVRARGPESRTETART